MPWTTIRASGGCSTSHHTSIARCRMLPASRPTKNVAWRQRYHRKEEALFPEFWSYRHQAKQGPFSRRSRHHLRWCLPYRSRASLSLAALTAHPLVLHSLRRRRNHRHYRPHHYPPPLPPPFNPGDHRCLYRSLSIITLQHGEGQSAAPTEPTPSSTPSTNGIRGQPTTTLPRRVVSVCDPRGLHPLVYAPADAGPTRSRCHRALHASCLKPGSAPSARWLAKSTAPRRAASARIAPSLRFRHDPC